MTEQVPLKRVALIRYGLGQPPPTSDSGVPIVRATNIFRGKIRKENLLRAQLGDLPLDRAPLLRAGEILVVRSGAYTGDSAIVTEEWEGSAPGYDLRVSPLDVDSRFAAYTLLSRHALEQMHLSSSRAAQPHLNAEELGEVSVWLPSREQQRRIADFLDAETARIDHLSSLRNQQVSRIHERYSVAISELTTPGISFERGRHADWPWLPAKIPVVRLGYLARVQSGVTVHGSREQSPGDKEYPYLRVANVQGDKVDLSEVKKIVLSAPMALRSTLQPGDVVMTEANGNPDNLGRGAVWHGEIPEMVHQNHIFAIRADQRILLPEYLSALLASSHGRRYFRHTSSQVGIATTSSSKVLDFPIPRIAIDRQLETVQRYQAERAKTRRAIEALQQQLNLLAERRHALVTAAVTGEFDVSTASGRGVME